MSRDVGKGLDPKRDEQKTSCTAGDEVCRGRRVGSGRHGKTEWGKGVPLTASGLDITLHYKLRLPVPSARGANVSPH